MENKPFAQVPRDISVLGTLNKIALATGSRAVPSSAQVRIQLTIDYL